MSLVGLSTVKLREDNYVVTALPVPKMQNEAQGMGVCWGRKTIFDNSIAD